MMLASTTSRIVSRFATRRTYVSRAHPQKVPEFSIGDALNQVLDGIEERKTKRETKWDRNKDTREKKGIKVSTEFILELI